MRRKAYLLAFAAAVIGLIAGVVVWRAAASRQYFSTNIELSVVAYPDPDHAWVAGDNWGKGGTIHATTNGGGNWREQEFGPDWSDAWGIAFANARYGWAVGSTESVGGVLPPYDSMLLTTSDGGAIWKKQFFPSKEYDVTGIACVSASHAWVVGDNMMPPSRGAVFVTRDGGAHWQRQYATKNGALWSIAFADARHGFAVGDGVTLATTDGGASWTQYLVEGCSLRSVSCRGARSAWAVGSDASDRDVVLATTDGGANWRVQHVGSGPNPKGQIGYCDVAFADARHGWVVGLAGTVLATNDGGRTWKPQRSGTTLDLEGVAFADAKHGIIVGTEVEEDDPMAGKLDGSIILRTSDGGTTWTK